MKEPQRRAAAWTRARRQEWGRHVARPRPQQEQSPGPGDTRELRVQRGPGDAAGAAQEPWWASQGALSDAEESWGTTWRLSHTPYTHRASLWCELSDAECRRSSGWTPSHTPHTYRVSPQCGASGAGSRRFWNSNLCHSPYIYRPYLPCGSSGAGSRRFWNSDLCHTPYIHTVLDQCDFSHVRYSSGWTWKLCHTPCTWRAFPHCGSSDAEGTLSCIGRSSHILYICRTSCRLGVSDWDSDWKSATLPCFQNPSAETHSWEALPRACRGPLCPQRLAALPPALLSWCPSHHLTKETTSFLITELEGKRVPAVLVFSSKMWYFKNIPWDGYELPKEDKKEKEKQQHKLDKWWYCSPGSASYKEGLGNEPGKVRWANENLKDWEGKEARGEKTSGRGKTDQHEMQTGFKRERGRPLRREETSVRWRGAAEKPRNTNREMMDPNAPPGSQETTPNFEF